MRKIVSVEPPPTQSVPAKNRTVVEVIPPVAASAGAAVAAQQNTDIPTEYDRRTQQEIDADRSLNESPEQLRLRMYRENLRKKGRGERFLEGATNVGRNVVDFLGGDENDPMRNQAISEDDWGGVGQTVTEIAATALPATGAANLVGKALGKTATYLPEVLRGGKWAGRVGNTAKTALEGATAGATTEALMNRDPVEGAKWGAALNVGTKAGIDLTTGAVSRAGRMVNPNAEAYHKLQTIIGKDNMDDVLNQLRTVKPTGVKGEIMTVADSATATHPQMAAIERFAREGDQAVKFSQIDDFNRKARQAMLRGDAAPADIPPATVGETGRKLTMAEQARKSVSDPLFKEAGFDRVKISPELRDLLDTKEIQTAIKTGRNRFAARHQKALTSGENFPAMARTNEDGAIEDISIEELRDIYDVIKGRTKARTGAAGKDADDLEFLIPIKQDLSRIMQDNSKKYSDAIAAHKVESVPVNQSRLFSQLESELTDATGGEQAYRFLEAVDPKKQAETIKRAEKNAMDSGHHTLFDQFLSPDQKGKVEAVTASLRRKAETGRLPTNASDIYKYETALDQVNKMTPPLFNQALTTARKLLKNQGQKGASKADAIITSAATDPQKMIQLLENLPATDRNKVLKFITDNNSNFSAAISSIGTNIANDDQ